ncbi:MAG: DUF354 domain-containing protein [Lentisphaerae bacterium]|nr:DUF354 domain-containing protein [Lentisphaerota bacterium]
MKILVDISHPAHAHFFRNAINLWREHGHTVIIVARDKEMNLRLLDCFGFEYTLLSRVRKGMAGLIREMIEHESKLYRLAHKEKPDIMLQIAGTFIVHAGKLLGIPTIVFYDTDNATLSNAITYPFATRICTPDCYPVNLGRKHVTYAGYHELAYLHPNRFRPNPSVLSDLGVKPGDPYYLLRFVSWGASHDVGESGLSPANKLRFAKELEKHGRVFVTSETSLPPAFEKYRIQVGVERIHDLMAYASLYLGESATMASECAMLGVPAIYISKTGRCYTTEQEKAYDMVYNFTNTQQEKAFEKMQDLLATPNLDKLWKEKQKKLLSKKIDVTAWMVSFVEQFLT